MWKLWYFFKDSLFNRTVYLLRPGMPISTTPPYMSCPFHYPLCQCQQMFTWRVMNFTREWVGSQNIIQYNHDSNWYVVLFHGSTNLNQPPGLGYDGILNTVQCKTIDLLPESHRCLPDIRHQWVSNIHYSRQCFGVWHQLHQTHIVGRVYLWGSKQERNDTSLSGPGHR